MNKKKSIDLLGSTGSIGIQTLSVLKERSFLSINSLSAGKNIRLLLRQVREFNPQTICVSDKKDELLLKKNPLLRKLNIYSGQEGLKAIGKNKRSSILVSATSGTSTLLPTIDALKLGKRVCVASKEIFLLYGKQIMNLAKKHKGEIVPIDSEHSGLFQILRNESIENINKVYITASGGPFYGKKPKELKSVTPDEALKHPTWNMGKKISIDSATMMNKAIEIIEASIIFNLPSEKIVPIINKKSHIHAIVEFVDGNVAFSGSLNDMKIPISYSLSYPSRTRISSINPKVDRNIDLIEVNENSYKAFILARKAMRIGGSLPTVMNAANTVAVEQFLSGNIEFLDIYKIIEKTMSNHNTKKNYSLKQILHINEIAQEYAYNIIKK
ncbi:MAG: 1-deoxy-D-xylulose-5-phosphate reductoisomerase [Thermodesulfobacteriota bacterium]|nr:MAG: 1-deoxy-D-xylulose-5-phosphate reductoisomerase [Candidatus Dadabacteria bacterium]